MEYMLGIDIGSSAAKAGLFSMDGEAAAIARRPYPTCEPLPGYKEQDPERWWDSTLECVREVSAAVGRDSIMGIGVTGHISSMTFVDAQGTPLRPALGFQDQRAVCETEEIRQTLGRHELARLLGIDLPPAPTWPLPRLLWFRKHEQRMLDSACRLLQAKDYINFRLTGNMASDLSSNRGIVNQNTGGIPHELFARFGLPESIVPPICGITEVVGCVCERASRESGLPKGIPVAGGWNDLNACVLGSGVARLGQVFNITGTSEHIGAVVNRNYPVPELVCAPFLPGRKLLYGVTSCGGGSLHWYAQAFGRPLEDLVLKAASAPAGCEGLLFLPYLEGERAPIWDELASGAFVGIRSVHQESHFVRAILEGVAFSLRQILEVVERNVVVGDTSVTVSGGASQTAIWNQIKADVLQRAIEVPQHPHAGILGAAILAAVATSRYSDCDEAVGVMVRHESVVRPDARRASRYDDSFHRYCQLYPALRSWFDSGVSRRLEAVNVR